ncbi:MAG: pyridoxamine 5'-phosphate oxidase family protein [Chromatiales bacterium]|nr:pyridoxamine 5'-phosphate oxidase family protein [Chromatiales bacterium]
MDIESNWAEIRKLFQVTFRTSLHYAIATVNENGEPHVTPIGSLILTSPGRGFYFEEFARELPRNLEHNRQVCVLAVNSGRWFWLKSLFAGRFAAAPGIRLFGTAGEARDATAEELARWRRRVHRVRHTRGHALLWRDMRRVRDIRFSRVEPIEVGAMTGLLSRTSAGGVS